MHYSRFVTMCLALAAAALPFGAPVASRAQDATNLPALTVLVRHADRAAAPSDDPPLSAAGVQRAKDLAAALRAITFSAIIATPFTRTRQTAEPIAAALGLKPDVIGFDSADRAAHVTAIAGEVRKHAGGAVLVVHHSDRIAAIIAALGGPRLPNICESVYDHLLMLVPAAGKAQLVNARYGAPSPPPEPGCM